MSEIYEQNKRNYPDTIARLERLHDRMTSGYHGCCGMSRLRGHHDLCHRAPNTTEEPKR